jgi:hypothetical protein
MLVSHGSEYCVQQALSRVGLLLFPIENIRTTEDFGRGFAQSALFLVFPSAIKYNLLH